MLLIGDGVLLLKDAIAEATVPVGWPSVKELMKTAMDKRVTLKV